MKELINIPKNDMRKYSYDILKNKIKYVLVQDKKIDTSYVSIVVKAGTVNESKKFQGLAHFLEHMLFLGSKKYTQPDYFDEFLNQNGGGSNATTGEFETNYFYEVNTNALKKSLDIFSRFFIDPLFDKNSIDKEVKIIQSEHDKNISNDYRIIYYLVNKLSKKNSQINRFGTGNLKTLNKKGIIEAMKEFYNDYYCSDNISISIISSINLEKLNSYVKKYFGLIKYKKSKKMKLLKPLFEKPTSLHYIPVNKTKQLIYFWEIPYFTDDINYNSWNIINYVFNDKNFNSLQNILKAKGLINYLFVDYFESGIFVLVIDLQSDNEKKLNIINGYISYFLDELKKLNWLNISLLVQKNNQLFFDNGDRDNPADLVNILATNCHYYQMEDLLTTNLIKIIDEKRILNLINNYLSINKSFQILVSKKEKKIKYKLDEYYFCKYGKISKIIGEPLKFNFEFDDCNSNLNVKPKYLKISSKLEIPKQITNNVWFGSTSKFNEPLFYSKYIFYNQNYINSSRKYLLNLILVDCINHYITIKYNKEFKLGFDIYLNINNNFNSLILSILGFNDKFNILFDNVVNFIKNCKIESYVLKYIIKLVKNSLNNSKKLSSWDYIESLISEQINKYDYDVDELLKELKLINLDDINNQQKYLFTGKLSVMYYGNIKKNDLPNLNIFKQNLKLKENKFYDLNKHKSMIIKHPNKKERNNCIKILYPCFNKNKKNSLIILFISNMIKQPFFNRIRTEDNLGYRVSCSAYLNKRNYFYLFEKVESTKKVEVILEKLSNFRSYYYELLLKINSKEWKSWVNNIKLILMQREESTKELFMKYFRKIISREYNFEYSKELLNELPNINLEDIQKFYKKYVIDNKNKSIVKLLKN